jgi:hypothetical protein
MPSHPQEPSWLEGLFEKSETDALEKLQTLLRAGLWSPRAIPGSEHLLLYPYLQSGPMRELFNYEEERQRKRSQRLQDDTVDLLTVISLSLDPKKQQLRRYIPIDLYVAESGDFANAVLKELRSFLNAVGFDLDDVIPPEEGSLRWRPRFYTREKFTASELETRFGLIERTITTMQLAMAVCEQESPEAQIDEATKLLELSKLAAEIRNLNADTIKTYLEAASKFLILLIGASIAVSILIGTVRIQSVVLSPEKQEINVTRVTPKSTLDTNAAQTRERVPGIGKLGTPKAKDKSEKP